MKQGSVLIYSDDAEFSRMVVNRWNLERSIPDFTVMGSPAAEGLGSGEYDLAILGMIRPEVLRSALKRLEAFNRPVLVIARDAAMSKLVRDEFPRFLVLRDYLGWVDAAVPLAAEVLRRTEAYDRVRRAEDKAVSLERFATLGRYTLEMRHTINNALTSVLGNAELLLMEPGTLSGEMRDQIETIHSMAMRIHEVMHRLSSLETEMSFAEKHSHVEIEGASSVFAS